VEAATALGVSMQETICLSYWSNSWQVFHYKKKVETVTPKVCTKMGICIKVFRDCIKK